MECCTLFFVVVDVEAYIRNNNKIGLNEEFIKTNNAIINVWILCFLLL